MRSPFLTNLFILMAFNGLFAQAAIGIGTANPNAGSVLDLGFSGKPLILPRLTSPQMNAISTATQGMIIYNTTEHQLYSWMRFRNPFSIQGITISGNRWQPISTGPAMIAWGVVDSFASVKTGSGNFSVVYNEAENW